VRAVIEAALEAELAEHLGYTRYDAAGSARTRNSRNGTRRKTVRTALGPVEIDVPRDRWGTFNPVTVGKWQREVFGIDKLLLPLAAKGASLGDSVNLLAQAYPVDVSMSLLTRIALTVRGRVAGWHERRLEPRYPILHLRVTAQRLAGRSSAPQAFAYVVGSRPVEGGSRHELLGLYSGHRSGEQWQSVLGDLRLRGLTGVRSVVGESSPPVRDAVSGLWPGATLTLANDGSQARRVAAERRSRGPEGGPDAAPRRAPHHR
jgi:transposase-like protein